jgi:hypothetical protein
MDGSAVLAAADSVLRMSRGRLWVLAMLLAMAFLIYVLLCGRARLHRGGWIYRLNRLMTSRHHQSLWVRRYVPGWLAAAGGAVREYVFYSRNPIFQGFYCLLIFGSYAVFLSTSLRFIPGPYIGVYHVPLSFGMVALTLYLYISVCRSDPGLITPESAAFYENLHPYDHKLFRPGSPPCDVCLVPRVARSMHCMVCRRCVARMDHHCVWINNCVGYGNQARFFSFLVSTAALCFYCAWGCVAILYGFISEQKMLEPRFELGGPQPESLSWTLILRVLMVEMGNQCTMFIFSFVMGVVVSAFIAYQFALVMRNITSMEMTLYYDLGKDIARARELLKHYNTVFAVKEAQVGGRAKLLPVQFYGPDCSDGILLRMYDEFHGLDVSDMEDYVPKEGEASLEQIDRRFLELLHEYEELDLSNNYSRGIIKNIAEVMSPSGPVFVPTRIKQT